MAAPAGLAETLKSLSSTRLTDDANLQDGLCRVAAAGCSLLANCAAASVSIIEHGRPSTVAATNDMAGDLDATQCDAGGPCLTAARERRPIRIDVASSDPRWPAFTDAAQEAGIVSSLSVPLDLGDGDGELAGGLNFYAARPSGFNEEDEQLAATFALQASIVVANAHAYWASLELTRHLTAAMSSRAVIEQAKGILMAVHRCSADDAFDLLRLRSQAENRKLRSVAADIVDEVLLGIDGEPDG
jgi:GAF domain-containing protein